MNRSATERSFSGFALIAMTLVFIGLYFTSWHNYLLFHSIAEIYSIVIGFSVFVIGWNSRKYIQNNYLLFVSVAYLFVSFLDLLHTLSYKGMSIFGDYEYYANQLWIGARFMESASLAAGFYFIDKKHSFNIKFLVVLYFLLTTIIVLSIFYWKIFPVCFVEGYGQTSFKIYSEYAICSILALSIYLLFKNRMYFEKKIFKYILFSIVCAIVSELSFTFYIDNYGFSNMVGHYFKIFSFIFIYLALIKNGIENPYDLIFKELRDTNVQLVREIEERKRVEEQKENLITSLQKAFEDIKVLEGIIPICMFCKKIRDDSGYWNQLEQFISRHSEAEFSHGICPTCYEQHAKELLADD